ncbi:MAG: NUDIX domain-containing protein [bacterium]
MIVNEKIKDFYQISLKLILKNNKGEVIILKTLEKGSYKGFYDLPGGRINTDEFNMPVMKILEREVTEEIGNVQFSLKNPIPVATGRHQFIAKWGPPERIGKNIHVLYLFFEGDYFGGDINISNEHSEYKWIKLEDIYLEKYFKSGILEGIRMYLQYYSP